MSNQLEAIQASLKQLEKQIDPYLPIKKIRYSMRDVYGAERLDFDDSDWRETDFPLPFTRDVDTVWFRIHFEIPKEVAGISLEGSDTWVTTRFLSATVIYIDGVEMMNEKFWADLRAPELFLPSDFLPGTEHVIAFRLDIASSHWHLHDFVSALINKRLDDIQMDVVSLMSELEYAATLPNTEDTLHKMAEWLLPQLEAFLDGTKPKIELPAVLAQARQLCEPIRTEAKKRKLFFIGHAHIDMNWFWSMEETKDVIYRDFNTVCNIADDYPTFCFSQSQSAAYQIVKEEHPELFKRMQEKVAAGNWDITASAWVEHDGNMPSGESFARQILYSQQFLKENFNVKPKIFWAPDSFGHSANIPMILQKSGISRYFMTRCGKEYFGEMDGVRPARMPGEVSDLPLFQWKGIGDNNILALNLSYCGEFLPKSFMNKMIKAEKSGLMTAIHIYGVGDHGGGPTRRDVERILKYNESPLYPQLLMGSTDDYYSAIEEAETTELRQIDGELNFVFEGCYSTHADIKLRNRKLESKLKEAETLAWMAGKKGYPYPYDRLRKIWQTLLFHQFHDIFDGCGDTITYLEGNAALDEALAQVDSLIDELGKVLVSDSKDTVTVINPIAHPITRTVLFPNKQGYAAVDKDGNTLESQDTPDGLQVLLTLKPLEIQKYRLTPHAEPKKAGMITELADTYQIENDYYCLILKKKSGQIITYFDKQTKRFLVREKLHSTRSARGRFNTFAFVLEAPETMSSWALGDTDAIEYLTHHAVSKVKENGPLIAEIDFKHRFRASEIRQRITFAADSPLITFKTDVTWGEVGGPYYGTPTLRVEFTPQVENRGIYSEIPFGVRERGTGDGEYPQLRFSAVQDEIGGVALLNNCKYGIHACGNQLGLTLIRSGWEPDLRSDIGEHSFTYQLYAFGGELKQTEILALADTLHLNPSVFIDKKPELESGSEVILPSQIGVSSIKAAESGDGIIARLYESFGDEVVLTLPIPDSVKSVTEVETGEDTVVEEIAIVDGTVSIRFTPYEMKTLLFKKQ